MSAETLRERVAEAIEDGLTMAARDNLPDDTPFVVKVHWGDIERAADAVLAVVAADTKGIHRVLANQREACLRSGCGVGQTTVHQAEAMAAYLAGEPCG